jgi:hypothetical protein
MHQKRNTILFYSFLFVYTLVLLYLGKETVIWEDEAYSLHTSSKDITYAITQSYTFEGQPPLYFFLLTLWQKINDSIFFARLFSILCIVFSLFVLKRILQNFKVPYPLLFSVLFALNPITVNYAIEIRTYALLILLSCLNLYFYSLLLLDQKLTKQTLFFFFIVNALGMFSQYLFGILLFSEFIVSVLILKFKKTWITLFIAPVILSFVAALPFLNEQINAHQVRNEIFTVFYTVKRVGQAVQNFVFSFNHIYQIAYVKLLFKLGLGFIIIYALIIIYNKKRDLFKERALLSTILLLISSIIGFICFFKITNVRYFDKYLVTLFPITFLLLFMLFKEFKPYILKGLLLLFFAFYIILDFVVFYPRVKKFDYKSVAQYINTVNVDKYPLFVYQNTQALPLKHYINKDIPMFQMPVEIDFSSYQIFPMNTKEEILQCINQKNVNTFYLVTNDQITSDFGIDIQRDLFNEVIRSNYNITLDSLVYGNAKQAYIRVRLCEKIVPNN